MPHKLGFRIYGRLQCKIAWYFACILLSCVYQGRCNQLNNMCHCTTRDRHFSDYWHASLWFDSLTFSSSMTINNNRITLMNTCIASSLKATHKSHIYVPVLVFLANKNYFHSGKWGFWVKGILEYLFSTGFKLFVC